MTLQNPANTSGNNVEYARNGHSGNPPTNGNTINDQGVAQGRREEEPKKRITDKMASNLSILYLLLLLAGLAWQLFDTWTGNHALLRHLGYKLQSQQTLRLVGFTLIAGALGGVVNGLRSSLRYHRVFDRRHTWKYLSAPWMGATLALFVFALLRSSISVLGGNVAGSAGNTQMLSNFSVGALAGYGSKDVFVWLDSKVESFFRVTPADEASKRREAGTSSSRNGRRPPTVNQLSPREPQMTQSGTLMHQRELSGTTVASTGKAN